MYKKAHTPGFKHKRRVIKAAISSSGSAAARQPERPEFQLNGNGPSEARGKDPDTLLKERMRDIERRVDRLNRVSSSASRSSKPRKRRAGSQAGSQAGSDREDGPTSPRRNGDELEPMLLRQLQELTQRMDAMQNYNSVGNLNLSPRGKNQHVSNQFSPGRVGAAGGGGYYSDTEADTTDVINRRSFPALSGNYGHPPMPMGGVGANKFDFRYGLQPPPPLNSMTTGAFDPNRSPYGKLSPDRGDEVRKGLTQQNMELQMALQDTRNEYLKAMSMLEGETFERQQLERKTGELANKLAASRQALAVTQTALNGLQDATQESSRTRDIRDIEIEKYLTEMKIKDTKIQTLEARSKDFDEHMSANLAKKDETIQKLQKKLTDALDTAYKAENDASTVSKDLSIAEQEIYSLRNRLSHMDLDHADSMKRAEKEYKQKIDNLNESLNKAFQSQDQSEKSVLRGATLEAKNIELEARVRYLDSAVAKTERERNARDEDIARLKMELQSLLHEKSLTASSLSLEMEDKIKQLEKNANHMTEREAQLISERNNSRAEADTFKKKIDELSDMSSNPIITELEYAKSLLQKENDHLKRRYDAIETELAAVKQTLRSNDEQSYESVKKQVSSKEDQIRSLYAELQTAKEDNAKLTKAMAESSGASSEKIALQSITVERDRLHDTVKKLESDLTASLSKQQAADGELVKKTRVIEDLERQLDLITTELTNLQTKVNSSTFVPPTAYRPDTDGPIVVAEPDPESMPVIAAFTSPLITEAAVEGDNEGPSAAPSADAADDPANSVDTHEEGKKKKKKKKGKKSSKTSKKSSKSAPGSNAGSDNEDNDDNSVAPTQVNIEQPVMAPSTAETVPRAPSAAAARGDSSASARNPTPPPDDVGRTSPFRRPGFSVPTPEPRELSAEGTRNTAAGFHTAATVSVPEVAIESTYVPAAPQQQTQPSPASQQGSAPLSSIFSQQMSMTPVQGVRKNLTSGGSSGGVERGASAASNGESRPPGLQSGTGNRTLGSAKSNASAADLRQELMECNNEKKRLKKGINKWNTDFLLNNNREAGVEDKSSDSVITTLYQQYHEISMVIKGKEEQLEGMKIYS